MSDTRPCYHIASIPGDGIGIEVVEAALEVLKVAARQSGKYTIKAEHIPWGTAYYKETGSYLPENFQSTLRQHDAVLFGAVGDPGGTCRILPVSVVGKYHGNLLTRVASRCAGPHLSLGTPLEDARPHAALRQRPPDSLLH